MWLWYNSLKPAVSTFFNQSVQLVWRLVSNCLAPNLLLSCLQGNTNLFPSVCRTVPPSTKKWMQVLRLTFQRNGSYSTHIQKVVVKCRARLNVIRMLKGTSWGAGKRPLLTVYRSLVRSVIEYGIEAYFFASPSLLKPLQKIQNDALPFCTASLFSTPVICLHHACNEMPLNIKHKFLCLKFKPISCHSVTIHPCR